jgi:hypothetical protein
VSDPFEEAARRYADEFASADDLLARARERLAHRLARSSDRACAVCGGPIPGAIRADAKVCSAACRQRRKRTARLSATT